MDSKTRITTFPNIDNQAAGSSFNCARSRRSSWAWLVLLSAVACTAIVDGLLLSFGLHLLEMLEASAFTTSNSDDTDISFILYMLPGALLTGMHLYASPMANVLSNRFDYRSVAMVSAILSGLILVSSAFFRNLEAFALFYGICGGLSCGLLYFPSLSIVAQWFESGRAVAVGLAICGSGVGTSLMAIAFPYVVRTFSWRGLLIIFGAVFLQLSLAIALFRQVEVQQVIDLKKIRRRALERRHERITSAIRHGKVHKQKVVTSRAWGGIINQILEEKFRQRSISTGSLDGMVITKDNELISLSCNSDCEVANTAAKASVTGAGEEGETASHEDTEQQLQTHRRSASDRSPSRHRPAVLLGPPVDFSASGVIRIADAVIRKLQAQEVIAPGMRCPNMANLFGHWSCGNKNALLPDDATNMDVVKGGRRSPYSQPPTETAKSITATTNTVGTEIANSSSTAGSSDVFDLKNDCLTQTDERCPISLFPSGSCDGIIDPRTDHAVISELSRVHLDSAVKAHIHAVIHRQLRHNAQLNSTSQKRKCDRSKTTTGDSMQQCSNCGLGGCCAEHCSVQGGEMPSSSSCALDPNSPLTAATTKPVENRGCLSDALHLQLLCSPSFLLFAFACTLHMFAFFAPYHILPFFLSLEDRTLTSNLPNRCTHLSSIFTRPERLAGVTSAVVTVGIAHLIGRLIATFYIDHIVSRSIHSHKDSSNIVNDADSRGLLPLLRRCRRALLLQLADPMTLNIVSLTVGGVCLLCLPLTTLKVEPTYNFSPCLYIPLRGVLFVCTFIHTVASAVAISMRSLLAVELISVHHLTSAFVYLIIFQGTGAIIGPLAIGLFAETASGMRISSRLLSEPQYRITGSGLNPLNWVYYSCGLVYLLSALAYAPLRLLSKREARLCLAKNSLGDEPLVYSIYSASDVSVATIKESANQPMPTRDTSFVDNLLVADPGCLQATLAGIKQKGSFASLHHMCLSPKRDASTLSALSIDSHRSNYP